MINCHLAVVRNGLHVCICERQIRITSLVALTVNFNRNYAFKKMVIFFTIINRIKLMKKICVNKCSYSFVAICMLKMDKPCFFKPFFLLLFFF